MGAALRCVLYLDAFSETTREDPPAVFLFRFPPGSVCRACVTFTARLASTHTALVSSPQKPGCSSLSIFTLL